MPRPVLQEIVEYRGIEGLVAAEVLHDDDVNGYVTDEVFAIAGVAEVSKTSDESSEAHYYDNIPAVVVQSIGNDTVNVNVSAIPLDVVAKLTGQFYDDETGAFIEGNRVTKYFAIGYIAKKTNGDLVYVWRYKGSFNTPDQTNDTEDNGTAANGQTLVYTGISTTHKFEKTGKGAKAINVDLGRDLADVSTFFDEVTTPDMLEPKTPATTYTITNTLSHCATNNAASSIVSGQPYAAALTADDGYELGDITVTMGGSNISSTAVISNAIAIGAVTGAVVISCTATPIG